MSKRRIACWAGNAYWHCFPPRRRFPLCAESGPLAAMPATAPVPGVQQPKIASVWPKGPSRNPIRPQHGRCRRGCAVVGERPAIRSAVSFVCGASTAPISSSEEVGRFRATAKRRSLIALRKGYNFALTHACPTAGAEWLHWRVDPRQGNGGPNLADIAGNPREGAVIG